MTVDEQNKHFEALIKTLRSITKKKQEDYATGGDDEADVLRNFKVAGSVAGSSAEQNCLHAIATKVARLGILLNTKQKPNNESIDDSIIDLINYGIRLKEIVSEKLNS